jgi:Family of unknown function (DUF5677)
MSTRSSPLSNHMFLDPALDSIVAHVRKTHSKHFDFAFRLNELAHLALFGAKIVRQDLQQILLATLQHRAMTAYQGVVLLSERGLPCEARVLLRTLLEVTFRIVAIAKDKNVARAYALQDKIHRKKAVNKYKLLTKDFRDEAAEAELNDLQSAVAQSIKDQDIKELKTVWFAQRADMMDFYNSAYAVLSDSVHVNVSSLESALHLDEDNNIDKFEYGPNDEDYDTHIVTAAEALLIALHAVYSIIDTKFVEQLSSAREELKLLLEGVAS